jgi:enediyne biosynthesis protein E5
MTTNSPQGQNRLGGLRRFAVAITLLNILGHTLFGFEQSWAQPLVALATAYSCEILLEVVDAWSGHRRPRLLGGWLNLLDFLLAPHITALAVAMLLYTNDRLWPTVLATAAAICSKTLFRAPVGRGVRHFFNPSNFGITITLLLLPWVGIAPPYHFTENLDQYGDWALPAVIIVSGTFLNARFTHRLPLICAWAITFFTQALVRSLIFGTPLFAGLLPMTGMAFILYTFYMVTDPATTPNSQQGQVLFGAAVAVTYGVLMVMHVVFGLFFALTIVCALRGLSLYVRAWFASWSRARLAVQGATIVREA